MLNSVDIEKDGISMLSEISYPEPRLFGEAELAWLSVTVDGQLHSLRPSNDVIASCDHKIWDT